MSFFTVKKHVLHSEIDAFTFEMIVNVRMYTVYILRAQSGF